MLSDSVKLVDNGDGKCQYEISTIWREGEPRFINNYKYAEKRLKTTLSSKLNEPTLYEQYEQKLEGWLKSGYTEKTSFKEPQFFLPHFPVIRQDKTTTKVRPVMDAAARSRGPDGVPKCLNDALLEGPRLINSIVDVLLRFRQNRIALIGDLREMFLQVLLPEADRAYHKFLWQNKETGEIECFQFRVHCFGNRASPAVAIFAIKHHAELHKHEYPRAVETVLKSTIVDDNCDSVDTADEAIKLIDDLKCLYNSAGLDIRKWASNSAEVLNTVKKEDRATNVVFSLDFEPESDLPKIKALGIIWLAEADEFTFLSEISSNQIWTKRTVLSAYSKLFDPLGLIAPVAMAARIIVQCCWRHDIDWDEEIPPKILMLWQIWLKALDFLPSLRISRCLKPLKGNVVDTEIHIFSDASEAGFGAVAYQKSILDTGEVSISLIVSKAQVAPVKPGQTVPQLELRGSVKAVSLFRLLKRVLELPSQKFWFWTDSRNVLAWLHTKRCLKRFVTNRVAEIKSCTTLDRWLWVPGTENPADVLSRGENAEKLHASKLWWHGPSFLKSIDHDTWPVQPEKPDAHVPDAVKEKVMGVPFDLEPSLGPANKGANVLRVTKTTVRLIKRYSDWQKYVRTYCWVLR